MSLHTDAHGARPSALRRAGGGLSTRARHLLRDGGDRTRTQRAALSAFAIRVASAGVAYLLQAVLARWMGAFEYGVFVFVWVWVLILGGLAPLGLSTSVVRLIPDYTERGRHTLLRGLFRSARLTALAISTAIALAGAAGLALFAPWITSYYVLPAYLALVCLPLYAIVDVQDGIARAYRWIDVALVPPYLLRPLFILAAMAAAYVLGFAMTAVTAMGAAIFGCWAAAVVQIAMLNTRLAGEVAPGPRRYRIGVWLAISAPVLLVHGFELLLQNTDILVLSLYRPPSDAAIYYAALKTIALMAFVHFSVAAAAANRFSAFQARGDHDGLQQAVRDATAWTFWPSLAAAVALLALGTPLLWLFGPAFTAGYPVMFILAAGFLVRAAMGPADYVLNMLGQQNACAAILSGSAALNLGLNFALIPPFGLYGAATATAIAIATSSVVMAYVAKRRLGLDLFVGTRVAKAA